MRLSLLFLMVFCAFTQDSSWAKVEKRSSMSFLIRKILDSRCRQMFKRDLLSSKRCSAANREMIKFIDFDYIRPFKSGTATAFSKELLYLFTNDLQITKRYLKGLAELGTYGGLFPTDFNLWDYTLEFYGSKKEAIRHLAILFQDTESKLHIRYLAQKIKDDDVLTTLELVNELLYSHSEIRLYPKVLEEALGPVHEIIEEGRRIDSNLYHFYVVSYLSIGMENDTPSQWARFNPFLLNSTYEFLKNGMLGFLDEKHGEDLSSLEFKDILRAARDFVFPRKLRPLHGAHIWSAVDIYLGHLGMVFAGSESYSYMSFNSFYMQLKSEPNALLQSLYLALR